MNFLKAKVRQINCTQVSQRNIKSKMQLIGKTLMNHWLFINVYTTKLCTMLRNSPHYLRPGQFGYCTSYSNSSVMPKVPTTLYNLTQPAWYLDLEVTISELYSLQNKISLCIVFLKGMYKSCYYRCDLKCNRLKLFWQA